MGPWYRFVRSRPFTLKHDSGVKHGENFLGLKPRGIITGELNTSEGLRNEVTENALLLRDIAITILILQIKDTK